MGEAAPPMLEDRAMPRRSALVMLESAGRLRRMGYTVSYGPQLNGWNIPG